MNKQQMREMYRGIIQFQTSISENKIVELLKSLMPLLQIPFDKTSFEKDKMDHENKGKPTVFCQHKLTDPRCMVLLEFWDSYPDLIIRFHETMETPVKKLLKRIIGKDDFQNCLIQHSKMNQIVKTHGLAIDIIDEFDLWNTLFRQQNFWREYIFFDENVEESKIYPELVDPISFHVTDDSGFMIVIGDKIYSSSLNLFHPSLSAPFELGWDDLAQWHPLVLRWEELEKICLYLTIKHPDHFVVPFLLLHRFAPVTKYDDEKAIGRRVKAAWRSLGLFTEKEIEEFNRMVHFKPHFTWSYEPNQGRYHACNSSDDIYSMRHVCTDWFPFRALEEVLKSIDQQMDSLQYKKVKEKWEALVSTYSKEDDEHWLERRKSAVESSQSVIGITDDDLPF